MIMYVLARRAGILSQLMASQISHIPTYLAGTRLEKPTPTSFNSLGGNTRNSAMPDGRLAHDGPIVFVQTLIFVISSSRSWRGHLFPPPRAPCIQTTCFKLLNFRQIKLLHLLNVKLYSSQALDYQRGRKRSRPPASTAFALATCAWMPSLSRRSRPPYLASGPDQIHLFLSLFYLLSLPARSSHLPRFPAALPTLLDRP